MDPNNTNGTGYDDRETLFLGCNCLDPTHLLKVTYWLNEWQEGDPPEFVFEVILNETPGFWKRLQIAFQYLFRLEEVSYYYFNSVNTHHAKELADFIYRHHHAKELAIYRHSKNSEVSPSD